ncbi:hypothetical protein Tco_0851245 [Tanacetum coccineum]
MSTRSSSSNLIPPSSIPRVLFEIDEEILHYDENDEADDRSVNIQAIDFGLKNHMIHHVQNSCQFHGLPGDDANKHLDKFLTITQSMKRRELNKEKLQDKFDIQVHKFFQMFKKLHFIISLAEALALMPKYHKMLKDLLSDKEKLLGLANTSLIENCSAVLLKNLPEKLGDHGKYLIPFDFPELETMDALAD